MVSIVGLINIATKTPAPVPLGEGLPIVSSKEVVESSGTGTGVLVAIFMSPAVHLVGH